MTIECTVSVSDYSDRGRGYRVRCFGLPTDDWNAMGITVYEAFHRTRASAKKQALKLMAEWHGDGIRLNAKAFAADPLLLRPARHARQPCKRCATRSHESAENKNRATDHPKRSPAK